MPMISTALADHFRYGSPDQDTNKRLEAAALQVQKMEEKLKAIEEANARDKREADRVNSALQKRVQSEAERRVKEANTQKTQAQTELGRTKKQMARLPAEIEKANADLKVAETNHVKSLIELRDSEAKRAKLQKDHDTGLELVSHFKTLKDKMEDNITNLKQALSNSTEINKIRQELLESKMEKITDMQQLYDNTMVFLDNNMVILQESAASEQRLQQLLHLVIGLLSISALCLLGTAAYQRSWTGCGITAGFGLAEYVVARYFDKIKQA